MRGASSIKTAQQGRIGRLTQRLASFKSSRLSLLYLVLSIAGVTYSRGRLAESARVIARETAALDSAIAASLPPPGDTASEVNSKLRDLTVLRRDQKVEQDKAIRLWVRVNMVCVTLFVIGVIMSAVQLFYHLRSPD
jgi:hypothetical protein